MITPFYNQPHCNFLTSFYVADCLYIDEYFALNEIKKIQSTEHTEFPTGFLELQVSAPCLLWDLMTKRGGRWTNPRINNLIPVKPVLFSSTDSARHRVH